MLLIHSWQKNSGDGKPVRLGNTTMQSTGAWGLMGPALFHERFTWPLIKNIKKRLFINETLSWDSLLFSIEIKYLHTHAF
ncbi:uncharacterized protein METZ01_LOCUS492379 [marine metagenome]|uniref:Uncharacterized protein n=1 Tax=marine metagenome TaxID=408172 RepID=A0A383D5I7_9ZZZZ